MHGLLLGLTLVFAAPGEIYRCVDGDGKASFQDRPCAGADANRRGAAMPGRSDDPAAVREWLASLSRTRTPATPDAPAARVLELRAPTPRASRPVFASERSLAICSERYYHCASANAATMDACVAAMPRCGSGADTGCCPAASVACYRSLRSDGQPLASAVRGALLGGDGGASCL